MELRFISVLFIFTFCFWMVSCTTFEEDISLTQSEKVILDKFKRKVSARLPQKYMREEIYLIRWLRARNFNIEQAEQLLNENLKWRKREKIDGILEEDFSEFEKDYPYYVGTVSKDGKPIFAGDVGDWDIRKAVVTGKVGKLLRYLTYGYERALAQIRQLQSEGKNVTQYNTFMNMDNFNIVQQACVQCMSYYIALMSLQENYYPGFCDYVILFNTPPVFEATYAVIRPLMSSHTRNSVQVYGRNKEQWSKVLLSIADKDQLPPEYGGTYRRPQ